MLWGSDCFVFCLLLTSTSYFNWRLMESNFSCGRCSISWSSRAICSGLSLSTSYLKSISYDFWPSLILMKNLSCFWSLDYSFVRFGFFLKLLGGKTWVLVYVCCFSYTGIKFTLSFACDLRPESQLCYHRELLGNQSDYPKSLLSGFFKHNFLLSSRLWSGIVKSNDLLNWMLPLKPEST